MKHLIELLVNPYLISIFLLGLCSLFLLLNICVRFVRLMVPIITLVLLLISSNWLPNYLSDHIEDAYVPVTKIVQEVRWIIVLAGGQTQFDRPTNSLLTSSSILRLVEGVRLYRMLPHAKLLLSGGTEPLNSEAEKMAELAGWFNIPASSIIQDTTSNNTEIQIQSLKSVVHDQSFYLVTSAVHMPRAMYLCKKFGLNPIAAPTDYYTFSGDGWVPNPSNIAYIISIIHEVLGKAWASIRLK